MRAAAEGPSGVTSWQSGSFAERTPFDGTPAIRVVAALPLEAQRPYDLWTWTPAELNGMVSARMLRAETVPMIDGARCTAWRVETEDEIAEPSVYWIEETTRSLLATSMDWMQIRVIHHEKCR